MNLVIATLVSFSIIANGFPLPGKFQISDAEEDAHCTPLKIILAAPMFTKLQEVICEQNLKNSTNTFFTDEEFDEDEMGKYFEGDMVLTPEQHQAIFNAIENRNGIVNASKRWPNNTVVYYIEEDDFDEDQVKMIEAAMADIANKSCITFRPQKDGKEHAVTFQNSKRGCFSNVGFSISDEDGEEPQVLNLSEGCFKRGTVVHEILHTLGFYHMQSTYNRDDFIKIVWENIQEGKEHNFAKYTNSTVTDFGVPYDYGSVMHYSAKAFSKNKNYTIVPLQESFTGQLGQRKGMSDSDIIKLNKMYCDSKIL